MSGPGGVDRAGLSQVRWLAASAGGRQLWVGESVHSLAAPVSSG